MLSTVGGATAATFLYELRTYLGASGVMFPAPSGRKALEGFLRSAVSEKRRSVLLSSFNCRVVLDAVLAAGMHAEPFDLADAAGRFDWEAIASRLRPEHGAVIVPHLFGVPTDFRPLRDAARRNGTLVIEDCAHTLGGRIAGEIPGTLGDAAIFSFSYDKPLSLGGGGALLVADSALASRVKVEHDPDLGVSAEQRSLDDFQKYLERRRRDISRSRLERMVEQALVGLGRRDRPPAYLGSRGIGPLRAVLGIWQVQQLPSVVAQRNRNAARVQAVATDQVRTWYVGPGIEPAWLKQKVMFASADRATRLSRALQARGLRVGPFNWPQTIDHRLGLAPPVNADRVAACGVDVPIHQRLTHDELSTIISALQS